MVSIRTRLLASALALGCGGSESSAPPPAPAAPAPGGCEQNLSGDWMIEAAPSYRYRFEDSGTLVLVHPYRTEEDPHAHHGEHAPPPIHMELAREGNALAGKTITSTLVAEGRECAVSFDTRITDCEPAALHIEAKQDVDVDERTCALTQGDELTAHKLVRVPDGG